MNVIANTYNELSKGMDQFDDACMEQSITLYNLLFQRLRDRTNFDELSKDETEHERHVDALKTIVDIELGKEKLTPLTRAVLSPFFGTVLNIEDRSGIPYRSLTLNSKGITEIKEVMWIWDRLCTFQCKISDFFFEWEDTLSLPQRLLIEEAKREYGKPAIPKVKWLEYNGRMAA